MCKYEKRQVRVRTFRSIDYICRIGGDEFGVLIFDSIENMDELLKQMDQEIIKYNRNNRYYLSIARGVSFLKDTEGKQKKISDWKYEADQDMYCNKKRRNINDRL